MFNAFQMPGMNLLKVNGYEGAKAYQMQPNCTLALFDINEDVFYVKSSDAGGFSTIATYEFKRKEDLHNNLTTDYVTRKEFEELKELINGKQSISE